MKFSTAWRQYGYIDLVFIWLPRAMKARVLRWKLVEKKGVLRVEARTMLGFWTWLTCLSVMMLVAGTAFTFPQHLPSWECVWQTISEHRLKCALAALAQATILLWLQCLWSAAPYLKFDPLLEMWDRAYHQHDRIKGKPSEPYLDDEGEVQQRKITWDSANQSWLYHPLPLTPAGGKRKPLEQRAAAVGLIVTETEDVWQEDYMNVTVLDGTQVGSKQVVFGNHGFGGSLVSRALKYVRTKMRVLPIFNRANEILVATHLDEFLQRCDGYKSLRAKDLARLTEVVSILSFIPTPSDRRVVKMLARPAVQEFIASVGTAPLSH